MKAWAAGHGGELNGSSKASPPRGDCKASALPWHGGGGTCLGSNAGISQLPGPASFKQQRSSLCCWCCCSPLGGSTART